MDSDVARKRAHAHCRFIGHLFPVFTIVEIKVNFPNRLQRFCEVTETQQWLDRVVLVTRLSKHCLSRSEDEFGGFSTRDVSRIRSGIAAGEFTRDSDDEVNIADFADHDANDEVDSDVNDNDSDGENEPALPEEWTSELINPPDLPFVDAANVGVNNVEQCRAMTAEQQFGLFNTDYILAL